MWELYNLSAKYHTPPSELIHSDDNLAGYCLDRAVYLFGSTVESEIDEARRDCKTDTDARTKTAQVLNRWLSDPGEVLKGVFRDPVAG